MKRFFLAALGMRRYAYVIVGLAVLAGLLFPTSAFASGKGGVGSAEWVTVGYGKGSGYQGYHHSYQRCPHGFPNTYVVKKGDTLSALAAHYKTTVKALAHANGIRNVNKIFVGQRLCVPHGHPYVKPPVKPPVSYCKATHTVKHYDTLPGIARRYHTTVHKIIADNNLKAPHHLHVGKQLCIR